MDEGFFSLKQLSLPLPCHSYTHTLMVPLSLLHTHTDGDIVEQTNRKTKDACDALVLVLYNLKFMLHSTTDTKFGTHTMMMRGHICKQK